MGAENGKVIAAHSCFPLAVKLQLGTQLCSITQASGKRPLPPHSPSSCELVLSADRTAAACSAVTPFGMIGRVTSDCRIRVMHLRQASMFSVEHCRIWSKTVRSCLHKFNALISDRARSNSSIALIFASADSIFFKFFATSAGKFAWTWLQRLEE